MQVQDWNKHVSQGKSRHLVSSSPTSLSLFLHLLLISGASAVAAPRALEAIGTLTPTFCSLS